MMKEEDIRLARLLLSKGILDKPRLERFQKQISPPDSRPCDAILVDSLGISENAVAETISQEFNIPFIKLTPSIITFTDQNVKDEFVKKYNAVPIIRGGIELTVAFSSPPYKDVVETMKRETKAFIVPVVALRSAFLSIVEANAGQSREEYQALPSKFQLESLDMRTRPKEKVYELVHANRLPNADIVADEIMIRAIKAGATDVYLEPTEKEFRVRFGIDGVLLHVASLPKEMAEPICNVLRTRGSLNMFDKKKAQDGRYTGQYGNFVFELRVNTLPTLEGERFAIRLTRKGTSILDLEEIGFSMENLQLVKHLLNRPRGLLIIAGPSGSGKSTTTYSCLTSLRGSQRNIMTVENPVEFQLDFASQVEVDPSQNMDYPNSMRAILRQHPDVIFLGEIRDSTTGVAGAEAALTGTMVISTMLASDALSVIPRMINFDIQPSWLAPTLNGVIFQQLARRVCRHCKMPYKPTEEMLNNVGLHQLDGSVTLFRGKGCEKCGGDGHLGRTTIHEVLVIDEELRDLIYNQASPVKLKEAAAKKGFESLRFDAAKKLMAGIISLEEYARVIG
ncbi:MAG: GspE/PulE family protein [Bacteroidota bacterium]|jgi:type II secretory ATPase GspE/PulE/Tfp pilus assembly ATPase PilB-like protein